MIVKLSGLLADQDIITNSGYVRFHFERDEKSRSVIGGIISIILHMFLLWIIIENGIRMFSRAEPYTASYEEKVDVTQDAGHLPFIHMSKILLEITQGSPDATVDIG